MKFERNAVEIKFYAFFCNKILHFFFFFYKDKENLSRQTLNVGLTGLFEGKNGIKDSLKVDFLAGCAVYHFMLRIDARCIGVDFTVDSHLTGYATLQQV